MNSTTRTMSKTRTALVGALLIAATAFSAAPANATPIIPEVDQVVSHAQASADQIEADQMAAAIAAIPTENIPVTSQMLRRMESKIVSRSAHRGERGNQAQAKRPARSAGVGALSAARTQAGDPYGYGAAGPNAYDCSGLTMWAYSRVGKHLPRTSGAQAGATIRVGRPSIGDLVFFTSGGSVYHVGLYAGGGMIFHSSQPGTPVGMAKIWTSSVFYGHVR